MRFQNNSSAGVARTRNYAYALANVNVKVIFASFLEFDATAILKEDDNNSNIYFYGSTNPKSKLHYKEQRKNLKLFLKNLVSISDISTSFLLYPSSYVTFDMGVLLYLKQIKKKKVFCEINEVRKYSVSSSNQKLSINYLKHNFNEYLAKYYDGLICISTNIEKYYSKFNKNILRVPILSNLNNFESVKSSYNSNSIFNIGFTGFISIEKENFGTFFEALKIIKLKKYKFLLNLYGGASNKELKDLSELVREKGLSENVKYHGKVNQEEIIKILRNQQLLVLPRRENLQNKYGFSTKLSEYVLSGVPILITDVSDNLLYFKDNINALVVNADDANDFATRIMNLIDNYKNEEKKLSQNALIVAKKHFDFRIYGEKMANFLFNHI